MADEQVEVRRHNRREALRLLLKTGYVAPAVTTVLLSSCQSGGPSGGMMLGPASLMMMCQQGVPGTCPPDM